MALGAGVVNILTAVCLRYCLCLFISGRRIKQALTSAKKLGTSLSSVVDFSNYLSETCAEEISKNSRNIGGEGQIVKVDESF